MSLCHHCLLAGSLPDCHQWQTRHQGQGEALSCLPGFPGQMPGSRRRPSLLSNRAPPTPLPTTGKTPRQSHAPHNGCQGGC